MFSQFPNVSVSVTPILKNRGCLPLSLNIVKFDVGSNDPFIPQLCMHCVFNVTCYIYFLTHTHTHTHKKTHKQSKESALLHTQSLKMVQCYFHRASNDKFFATMETNNQCLSHSD